MAQGYGYQYGGSPQVHLQFARQHGVLTTVPARASSSSSFNSGYAGQHGFRGVQFSHNGYSGIHDYYNDSAPNGYNTAYPQHVPQIPLQSQMYYAPGPPGGQLAYFPAGPPPVGQIKHSTGNASTKANVQRPRKVLDRGANNIPKTGHSLPNTTSTNKPHRLHSPTAGRRSTTPVNQLVEAHHKAFRATASSKQRELAEAGDEEPSDDKVFKPVPWVPPQPIDVPKQLKLWENLDLVNTHQADSGNRRKLQHHNNRPKTPSNQGTHLGGAFSSTSVGNPPKAIKARPTPLAQQRQDASQARAKRDHENRQPNLPDSTIFVEKDTGRKGIQFRRP